MARGTGPGGALPVRGERLAVEWDFDSDRGGHDFGSVRFGSARSARQWMVRELRGRFVETGAGHLLRAMTRLEALPLEVLEQGVDIFSDGDPLFAVTPLDHGNAF